MQLAGDEAADVLLSFFGATADVRGQDHVLEALKFGDERLATALWLARENVYRSADDVAALDLAAQRPMVDDKTPGKVQENAPRDHVRKLRLAEHPFVARPPVNMQRDDVDRSEELFQRRTMLCITHGQLVGSVVEPDRHAE